MPGCLVSERDLIRWLERRMAEAGLEAFLPPQLVNKGNVSGEAPSKGGTKEVFFKHCHAIGCDISRRIHETFCLFSESLNAM